MLGASCCSLRLSNATARTAIALTATRGKFTKALQKPKAKRERIIVKDKRPIITMQREINTALDEKAKALNLDWRLVSATVMHRYPTITKDPEEWEDKFRQIQEKIDAKRREWFFSQIRGTDSDIACEENPGYQEIIDSMPFQPASRITEADEKNDRRSMDRRLQDSLFLIVKRNRTDNAWQFPQGKVKIDAQETLRGASERVIDRAVGKMDRWFISNAPTGHWCYEYPAPVQEQRKEFGAKIFYFRCQMIKGTVRLQTKLYTDYAWVARDEVGEYFDPKAAELIKHMLPS